MAERTFTSPRIRWPGIYIISGQRTRSQQQEVNPTQPFSLHRRTPSLAVDLRVGDVPATLTPLNVWKELAVLFETVGVRWGGADDPNHFFIAGTPVA